MSALWGIVTDMPRNPKVRIAVAARAASPEATGSATQTQSRPVAANAALWITGDNEWPMGSPMTATTWVRAEMPDPVLSFDTGQNTPLACASDLASRNSS